MAKNSIRSLAVVWKQSKPTPIEAALAAPDPDAAVAALYAMDKEPFAALLAAMDDPHAAAGTFLALLLGCSSRCGDTLIDAFSVAEGVAEDVPLTPEIRAEIRARIELFTRDHAAFVRLEEAYCA